MGSSPRFAAYRAFAHPLWVGSLLVLLVNDHLLKGSGVLPGWLTGKLSDFAGLFMAPALLAALLKVRTRRGFFSVHAGLGLFFAALKLWAPAARGFEASLGWVGVPAHVVVDPTDLLALVSLFASFLWLTPLAERGREVSRRAQASGLMLASFASIATSAPQPNPVARNTLFPPVQGSLGLANDTGASQVIRVRELNDTVQMDCGLVGSSPTTFLHPELFAPAESWLVEDQRILPLTQASKGLSWRQQCQVLLIDGDRLQPRLVFWMLQEFPDRSMPSALNSFGLNEALLIRATAQAEKVVLSTHDALFPAPSKLAGEVSEECKLPEPESALVWSSPLPNLFEELTGVTASPDGCVALDFASRRVYLCGLPFAFPFLKGDRLKFQNKASSGDLLVVQREGDTTQLILGRGAPSLVSSLGLSAQATAVEGCLGQRIDCGGLARPAQLQVGEDLIRSGEQISKEGLRFALLSASYQPVFDTACSPTNSADPSGVYTEWAAVTNQSF